MALAEQQIIGGAAAALQAAGLTVFAGRTEPATETEMPCVFVRAPTTSGQELGHHPVAFAETAQLIVSMWVRSLSSEVAAETAVNALEQVVRLALFPCPAAWVAGSNFRVTRFRSQLDAPASGMGSAMRARHLFMDLEYSQEYDPEIEHIAVDSIDVSMWAKRLAGETTPETADIEARIELAPEEEP